MPTTIIRRLTGAAGLAAALLHFGELALFFSHAGAPPDSTVFATTIVAITGGTLLVVFMTGLRHLVRAADPAYEFAGTLGSTAGLMWVLLASYVFLALGAGEAIASAEPIDQTVDVTGTYLLGGSIGRIIEALWMGAFGYAIVRTGVLPRWIGRIAYVMVPINLAFVPSIYFGNDPAFFYAANGWGTAALMGFLTVVWILIASIGILRTRIPGHRPVAVGAR